MPRSTDTKPTARVDARKLARGTTGDDEVNRAFEEWDGASGTPPRVAPLVSRTATVHDPLTTGLLAEASRQDEDADEAPAFTSPPERPTRRMPPLTTPKVTQNVVKRPRKPTAR